MSRRRRFLSAVICSSCFALTLALMAGSVADPMPSSNSEATSPSAYVGSQVCAECHTDIYDSWQKSSHALSVMTAEQARVAGFPLPPRSVQEDTVASVSWDEISLVVGGRERLAFVNQQGRVLRDSYHHRVGKWDPFPTKTFDDCAACHTTGYRLPSSTKKTLAWKELNIGCESCHGPGQRHMQTYDAQDVLVDDTSRTCGRCHTAVNRALPPDEWHLTHDHVQTWNADPHVTGLRFHSHSAFCARCHAPGAGYFVEAFEGAQQKIFSEQRQTITCVACHDPHGVHSGSSAIANAALPAPQPTNVHLQLGDDDDFTTPNHQSLDSANASCMACHRGADRIDLDHAHATCVDCHNTFHHNRSSESRVYQDANHPGLSCRQCHEDGDHLLTLLFQDPDFLSPRTIHNLRKMPVKALEKYAFRYPDLAPSTRSVTKLDYSSLPEDDPTSQEVPTVIRDQRLMELQSTLSDFWSGLSGNDAAPDATMDRLQQKLMQSPRDIEGYWLVANALLSEQEAARLLALTARADLPRVVLHLGFDPHDSIDAAHARRQDLVKTISGLQQRIEKTEEDCQTWYALALRLAEQRYAAAHRPSMDADTLSTTPVYLKSLLALIEISEDRPAEAVAMLTAGSKSIPGDATSQVVLGLAYQQLGQFTKARDVFLQSAERGDPFAEYLLGWGYLEQQNPLQAIKHYQAAVREDPQFDAAQLALARAYRLAGNWQLAVEQYRELIRSNVKSMQPHLQLAKVYKSFSDHLAFQWLAAQESGATQSPYSPEENLIAFARRSREYRQLARDQYVAVLRLAPDNYEALQQLADLARRDKRFEAALRLFDWLAERKPEEWVYAYRRGVVLIQLGRQDEAIAALEQARDLAPVEGDIYSALAVALLQQGKADQAVEVLQLGIVHEPFNPTMFTNLGVAYGMLGEFAKARAALHRSLELATFPLPRVHLTHTNLAIIHIREGEFVQARQSADAALHAYPGYFYARELIEQLDRCGTDAIITSDLTFVVNDLTEIFGEVTTVTFDHD